ncbi:MAG: hypothetical protein ACI88A_001776 [Paraglaciecola sp.]|jgi:hypothetical protein
MTTENSNKPIKNRPQKTWAGLPGALFLLRRYVSRVCHPVTMVLMLFVCTFTLADNWYVDGEADKATNKGAVGDFGAMLLMTANGEQALKNWFAPPSEGFHVSTDSVINRNVPIEALIVFSGCKANEQGNCFTEVDYLIVAPDGSVYGDFKNTELWKNKSEIPAGKLGLAVDRVIVSIEDNELLGEYQVVCTIRDLIAGVSFKLVSKFTVVEKQHS